MRVSIATEPTPHQTRSYSRHGILIGVPILLAALIVFSFEIRSISLVNGWWFDELLSIWASDPSHGFMDVLRRSITVNATPPLYDSALFGTRQLVSDERTAIIVLNLISLAVTLIVTSIASRKAGVLGWALIAGASFLLSGSVLRYVVEGRGYLVALSATFVVSWYSALAIEVRDKRPHLLSFGLVGVISALIHLYAALICGCLAAGLIALAVLAKRKDLLAPGLTLGISTCAITALSLPVVMNKVDSTRWTELSLQWLLHTYWEIKLLALGSNFALLLLVGLFVAGLMLPATRSLSAAFGLAFVLFLLLPILASLKKPMIGARYWLIGTPCILTFVSFVTRAFLVQAADGVLAGLYRIGAAAGLSFLVVTDINGFSVARAYTAEKPIWNGATIVSPLLQHCPSGSVHVFTSHGFVPGFAFLAHGPEDLFSSADAPETAWIDAAESACPVLGWAEHVFYRGNKRLEDEFVSTASDDELLQLLKIRALPSQVDIYRHRTGFVVLRRGTRSPRIEAPP